MVSQKRKPKYDIFISYSRKDRDLVERLSRFMKLEGRRVFRDEESIEFGDVFQDRILDAINSSSTFVVFWCCHCQKSKWVAREITEAIARNGLSKMRVAPTLLCKSAVPEELRNFHSNNLSEYVSHSCNHDCGGADANPHASPIPPLLINSVAPLVLSIFVMTGALALHSWERIKKMRLPINSKTPLDIDEQVERVAFQIRYQLEPYWDDPSLD